MDLAVLDTVTAALGLKMTLEVEGRHLTDRANQRDPVHAAMAMAMAGRLARCSWQVATEVPTGRDTPTGWVDLLAFRERDAALAVVELKADLPDIGGLQRQVGFYEREAPFAARRLGCWPASITVIVVCLNSATVAQRLRDHRTLLAGSFPGDARVVSSWLREAGRPTPLPSLVLTDLARRRGLALVPSGLHGRAPFPAYHDYADAAAHLAARRTASRRAHSP
jgi:hypothetical protein